MRRTRVNSKPRMIAASNSSKSIAVEFRDLRTRLSPGRNPAHTEVLPNVVLHPDIFIEAELLFVTRALISDLQPIAVGIQINAVICDGAT